MCFIKHYILNIMMGTMITVCKPGHVPPHRHSSVKLKEKNTVLFIYVCLEIYMYKHISKNT
jgi:hypothetical protein